MTTALARTAGALAALLAVGPALADIVQVGTIQQLAPRPVIGYWGGYGGYVTSSLVVNPEQRTLVTIDIAGILQAAGLNYLERIDVLDGGGNQYNGSPGADIDFWSLDGLQSDATATFSYVGINPTHLAESSSTLATRMSAMDAISGDQDYNCLHFVSLGQGGRVSANFMMPAPNGGSGGSGGLGEINGGAPPGSTTNLLQVLPGLKLNLNEAGLGEKYSIQLVAYALPAVPAPGVIGVLCGAGALVGRGRRRRG
ncbi:MAG: hypothetical protein U0572_07310 [Phycisphaerales bacterium]